jgi:hypothetical protein
LFFRTDDGVGLSPGYLGGSLCFVSEAASDSSSVSTGAGAPSGAVADSFFDTTGIWLSSIELVCFVE